MSHFVSHHILSHNNNLHLNNVLTYKTNDPKMFSGARLKNCDIRNKMNLLLKWLGYKGKWVLRG